MFQSETGIRVPAVTAAQMREFDRIAVEETGPNLLQMMENAGSALAQCAVEMLGRDWRSAKVIVFAGSGGNGGGGLCAARHLSNRGMDVRYVLSKPIAQLKNESAFQCYILRSTGACPATVSDLQSLQPDLMIDALIGYGLDSKPRGEVRDLIRIIGDARSTVLSLDVPSGVDATTGEHPGEFVKADRTLTLALPKTGLFSESAGEILLADIGVPSGVYQQLRLEYQSPFDGRHMIRLERRTPLISFLPATESGI